MSPANDPEFLSEKAREALYRVRARNDERRKDILRGCHESEWQRQMRMRREDRNQA